MPFTSRNTIKRMVRNLPGKPEASNLASLICVSSYAGYFLQEIVLSDKRKYTGLEDELRLQAVQCFATARAAISRTLLQAPSTLENLQALTYGASLLPLLTLAPLLIQPNRSGMHKKVVTSYLHGYLRSKQPRCALT